jgi:hypothetical protein
MKNVNKRTLAYDVLQGLAPAASQRPRWALATPPATPSQRVLAVPPVSSGERNPLTWTPAVPAVSSGRVHHLANVRIGVRNSRAPIPQHLQDGGPPGSRAPCNDRDKTKQGAYDRQLWERFGLAGSWTASHRTALLTSRPAALPGLVGPDEAGSAGQWAAARASARRWRAAYAGSSGLHASACRNASAAPAVSPSAIRARPRPFQAHSPKIRPS